MLYITICHYNLNYMFVSPCSKTERKIGFASFKKALELCAEKKYGNKDQVQKLIDAICAGKGPVAVGATVSHPVRSFVVTNSDIINSRTRLQLCYM